MSRLTAVPLLLLTGCGAAIAAPPSPRRPTVGPCAVRSGPYSLALALPDGGCASTQVTVDGPPVVAGCQGTYRVPVDNCTGTTDRSCPAAGGGTYEEHGVINWSVDGRTGSGTVTFAHSDPAQRACDGTFIATYTHL